MDTNQNINFNNGTNNTQENNNSNNNQEINKEVDKNNISNPSENEKESKTTEEGSGNKNQENQENKEIDIDQEKLNKMEEDLKKFNEALKEKENLNKSDDIIKELSGFVTSEYLKDPSKFTKEYNAKIIEDENYAKKIHRYITEAVGMNEILLQQNAAMEEKIKELSNRVTKQNSYENALIDESVQKALKDGNREDYLKSLGYIVAKYYDLFIKLGVSKEDILSLSSFKDKENNGEKTILNDLNTKEDKEINEKILEKYFIV